MEHTPGNLFVVAAPSGAGKTSLVKALSESVSQLKISVSHTTRLKRHGEINAQDYFFIDEKKFQEMIAQQAFLEYATVYHHHYGTSKDWVYRQLSEGIDVILEIDWQGARQIHTLFPKAVLIFIFPPSLDALKNRLNKRQQDDADTIAERMQSAQNEMSHYREFDFLIVNDQFEAALQDLKHIVLAMRFKTAAQAVKHAQLLENLLKK